MTTEREREGWLILQEGPAAPRHRVLLLPDLFASARLYAPLLAEPALAEAGVHLLAGCPPGFAGARVAAGFDGSVEGYAALVEELAAAEHVDLVVGHGYTAAVALEVAVRGAYRGKLMLVSPALGRAAEARELARLDRASRSAWLRPLRWWRGLGKLRALHARHLGDPELLDALARDAARTPSGVTRRVLNRYFDHLDRHADLSRRLIRTRTPVYVVRGERDGIGFTTEHEAVLKASRRIRIYLVLGARYFAMVDQPGELAKLILRFLDEDWDE